MTKERCEEFEWAVSMGIFRLSDVNPVPYQKVLLGDGKPIYLNLYHCIFCGRDLREASND